MLSVSASIAPIAASSPAFIRKRSRSVPLERTLKPYRHYAHNPTNWHQLFLSFHHRPDPSLKLKTWMRTHAKGIQYRTFLRRYQAWMKADQPTPPPPLPSHLSNRLSPSPCSTPGLGDRRGGHNRNWSREDEKKFVDVYVKPVVAVEGISNDGIRVLAEEFESVMYKSTSREGKTRGGPAVMLSSPAVGQEWMTRLKLENDLYSGGSSFKRQQHITDKETRIAQLFIRQVRAGMHRYGAAGVIAMDETFWNLYPKPQSQVKVKGEETKIVTSIDTKAGISTILTITADGNKLPLFFICKGKTQRCSNKLHAPLPHIARYTKTGWCREHVLYDYIEHIILPYTSSQPCLLILDSYDAHINFSYHINPDYNIEIAFVPVCMTATLSPLDVVINPTVKSIGKGDFRKMVGERREEQPVKGGVESYSIACASAIDSFKQAKKSTVVKAFEQSIGDISDEICEKAYKEREKERVAKERETNEREERVKTIATPFNDQIDAIEADFKAYVAAH